MSFKRIDELHVHLMPSKLYLAIEHTTHFKSYVNLLKLDHQFLKLLSTAAKILWKRIFRISICNCHIQHWHVLRFLIFALFFIDK